MQKPAQPYVCLVPNKNITFRQAAKSVNPDGSCSSGTRLCPEQVQTDDDTIQICVPTIQPCPINSMVISSQNPSALIYKKGPSFGENLFLYFSSKTSKPILSQFRLTEDSVCFENDKANISQGRSDSIFLASQRERCPLNQQDLRFTPIVRIYSLSLIISLTSESKISSTSTTFLELKSLRRLLATNLYGNFL